MAAENSENIEAKLCAYVDGELDEQDRAEIEKHLEANPSHRKLLAELTGMRDLLRGLPREPAPADIAETLNAQLERSVLLDDAPADDSMVLRHRAALPQLVALAAIVILAVGLGAVVYFALPPEQARMVFVSPPAGPGTQPVAEAPAPERPRDEKWGKGGTPIAAASPVPAPGGAPDVSSPVSRAAANALDSLALGTLDNDSTTPMSLARLESGEFDAGAGGGSARKSAKGGRYELFDQPEPVVVVISADDLPKAKQQVTGYLTSNSIRWEPGDEPMPEALALRQGQQMNASRLSSTDVYLQNRAKQRVAALNLARGAEGRPGQKIATTDRLVRQMKVAGASGPATQQSFDQLARANDALGETQNVGATNDSSARHDRGGESAVRERLKKSNDEKMAEETIAAAAGGNAKDGSGDAEESKRHHELAKKLGATIR